LLHSIYADYLDHSKRQGRPKELTIKKIILGQSVTFSDDCKYIEQVKDVNEINMATPQEDSFRITPQKIS
jgi:hypothetical protein